MKRRNTTLPLILFLLVIVLGIILFLRARLVVAENRAASPTAVPTMDPLDVVWPTPDPLDTIDPTPTPTPEPTPSPAEAAVVTPKQDIPLIGQPEQGRYGQLYLSADEIETLARLVYLEARGESFEGQQAVAEVVLNRVLSPSFPDNVYDVIYQVGQFAPAGNIPFTVAMQTQYDAVACALSGPNILPQAVCYFAAGMNGRSQAWGWIGHHCFCY